MSEGRVTLMGGFDELTLVSNVQQAKPREAIPSTAEPINSVLVKPFAHRSVHRPADIHDGVMIVEDVDAALGSKIDRLG